MELKLLIAVRHGDCGTGCGDEPLSDLGIQQMQGLRRAINALVSREEKKAGQGRCYTPLFFSFSHLRRAIQSTQELCWVGCDIVTTDESYASRRHINGFADPERILKKVLGLAGYYGASVVVIVAHGDMPAVIAETAYESVTGLKPRNFPPVIKGHGFAVNMTTGEVVPIGWDDHVPAESPPATQGSDRPVIMAPPRSGQVVIKGRGGEYDEEHPIPFL